MLPRVLRNAGNHRVGDSVNYTPNTIDWNVGDLVIHDADQKSERMLMRVIEPALSGDDIKSNRTRSIR
jgi:hypothetical protein